MNEVATIESNVEVIFTPSQITIQDKEKLEQAVKAYASKFEGLVATEENLADVKKVKAELNKINTGLTARFRDIKKEYMNPLNEVDLWIKSMKGDIQAVIAPIDEAVKELDERQKQQRINKIHSLIKEMSEAHGITPEDKVEIKPEWANKGNFTTKGEVNLKITKEISEMMNRVKAEKDRLQGDISIITNYSKTVGLDPESWISLIELGQTAPDVMKQIDKAIADKKAREAQEEEERIKREEYEQAMQKLREEQMTEVDGQSVDTETGEIVSEEPKLQKVVLELTGTVEQFQAFNKFLVANGIGVKQVG